MKLVDIVKVGVSNFGRSERMAERKKMCISGEFVHHHEDAVVFVGLR